MIAALLALSFAVPQPPSAPAPGQVAPLPAARVLVVPFETPGRDGRTYWLGEGVAVLLADDMASRGVAAIPRQVRARAYEQLHLPPNAVLSRATVIKVGELAGAVRVVVGEVQVEGDALTIRARPIRIDVGRAETEVVERGTLPELFGVAGKLAQQLAPGAPPPASDRAPPLHAFELFVKGLLAERPASQAEFLEAALAVDPQYDRARLALWDVRTAEGNHAAALAAARAVSAQSPSARRARFLSSVSLLALKQYDESFATLKGLADAASGSADAAPSPAVLNNLGIVQIRRGSTPETGKPVYYLTRAAEADPEDADILFNLGYAYALDKDPQAAIYWLREALRRNPADGDAHEVLAAELEASGSAVEAGRERELAAQLSARYAEGAAHASLRRGLERVRQDFDAFRAGSVSQALATTVLRDQENVAQFYLERGRRLFAAEQDREAMAELQRAVFLSPYEAEAHLLIGRLHLRAGRPREAIAALKISIWSRDTAAARVALGAGYLALKEKTAARDQAQKALALDPASIEAAALLRKIDGG